MIDYRAWADELLADFSLCQNARPKHNAVEVQLEKDSCAKWAQHVSTQLAWGSESELAEACNQFSPRLKQLKEKVIIEILTHGSV